MADWAEAADGTRAVLAAMADWAELAEEAWVVQAEAVDLAPATAEAAELAHGRAVLADPSAAYVLAEWAEEALADLVAAMADWAELAELAEEAWVVQAEHWVEAADVAEEAWAVQAEQPWAEAAALPAAQPGHPVSPEPSHGRKIHMRPCHIRMHTSCD
jgi:hypothetical protein